MAAKNRRGKWGTSASNSKYVKNRGEKNPFWADWLSKMSMEGAICIGTNLDHE